MSADGPYYHIPGRTERHPARIDVYRERIDEVVDQVNGRVPCYPISNPCTPEDQWRQMVALVRDSTADGMWVNMYGYLSEPKCDILRRMWS